MGKSTLFNRLTGTREAVVAPEAGVTRDRKEGAAEWTGHRFVLVDTGGIDLQSKAPLSDQVRAQARVAIADASMVIFVVDGKSGVGPQEHEIAEILRNSQLPVVLAVNKIDARSAADRLADFWELGLGEPVGVSAEHGLGTGDLLDVVVGALPTPADDGAPRGRRGPPINIAIVGRPNVGKSSLVNALLGDERVIVSPIPGPPGTRSTRPSTYEGRLVNLVDTAGLRRKGKRTSTDVEFYSSLRTLRRAGAERRGPGGGRRVRGAGRSRPPGRLRGPARPLRHGHLFNKWDVATLDLDMAVAQHRPQGADAAAVADRLGPHRPQPRTVSSRWPSACTTSTADASPRASSTAGWTRSVRRRDPPQRGGKSLKLFYMVAVRRLAALASR